LLGRVIYETFLDRRPSASDYRRQGRNPQLHSTPLIALIVGALVMAFALGTLAHRLRISPLVGYLLAGVVLGPFTPGFVANQEMATELAEVGVILLMFGVGMHFSVKELFKARKVAVPGALTQIAVATVLGIGAGMVMGWSITAGIVFGLCLSTASTVVLIRAVDEQGLLETERGRIAVGWLIVEDIAMVLALVLLPAMAGTLGATGQENASGGLGGLALDIAIALGKVGLFVAFMLIVGRRVIPWVLHYMAWTGSRELFRLAVLAIALGVAYGASELFGVSFALGAFFAGMVLAESELSQQAAEETLPLRDAFAVLFFVSVGMLFDPAILVRQPWQVLSTLFIIIIGKSVAAYLIVRAFGRSKRTAFTISASLAQIGEFSFILSALGLSLGLLPAEGRDLIITGAILSILANPIWFALLARWEKGAPVAAPSVAASAAAPPQSPDDHPEQPVLPPGDHAVVVGYGRVGSLVAQGFKKQGIDVVVVEGRQDLVARAREDGFGVVRANAAQPGISDKTNLLSARWLVVAIPSAFEAGQIVEHARAESPNLTILARAHFDAEVEHLKKSGASFIVMGEREIAKAMLEEAFRG